jgi:hypothetical protein
MYSKPLLSRLQLPWMSDNLDQNMKSEKCRSQLSTYFKRHMAFRKASAQLPVQTKLDSSFEPALLHSEQVQLLSLLSANKCIVFL